MLRLISLISILIVHSQLSFGWQTEVTRRKVRGDGVNVINKGVWTRNKQNSDRHSGAFLFRGNMAEDYMQQGDLNDPSSHPFFERNKRSISTRTHRNRRFRKSLSNCEDKDCKGDNNVNTIDDQTSRIESETIKTLKKSLVFKDYPYKIDISLNNKIVNGDKNHSANAIHVLKAKDGHIPDVLFSKTVSPLKFKSDILVQENITKPYHIDDKAWLYDRENIEVLELTGGSNKTGYEDLTSNKVNRGVMGFGLKDSSWRSSSPMGPIPILANFKVKSTVHDKAMEEKMSSKLVNDKGLVKILGILTKTFKKIMKQHQDIKAIESNVHSIGVDFARNIEMMSHKLRDFDEKFMKIIQFHDGIKLLENKLKAKEEQFSKKEQELSKNLMMFQNQQQKFLAQQRQFYSIQKFMLEQNEKFNIKQNNIAKTQKEISNRQNHIAQILKKIKQIYTVRGPSYNNNKSLIISHFDKVKNVYIDKPLFRNENKPQTITLFDTHKKTPEINKITEEVTPSPMQEIATTDSVKINLFSLQSDTAKSKLENQDSLLLKDKDYNTIDDLVYKYYFNNTFIDDLMKGIVSTFLTIDATDALHNPKTKRQELVTPLETTILLPVDKTKNANSAKSTSFEVKSLNRKRRWIKNHVKRKWHKKYHVPRVQPVTSSTGDAKTVKSPKDFSAINTASRSSEENLKTDVKKDDPYTSMATNFCNAIGQNSNTQELGWCVEKSLRKLKNIAPKPVMTTTETSILKKIREFIPVIQNADNLDSSLNSASTVENNETSTPRMPTKTSEAASATTSETPSTTYATVLPTKYGYIVTQTSQTTKGSNNSFPDNDQLESNLKEYDQKPDTSGTVYYDGSLHVSDTDYQDKQKYNEGDYMMSDLDSSSLGDDMNGKAIRQALIKRMKYEMHLKKMNKLRMA